VFEQHMDCLTLIAMTPPGPGRFHRRRGMGGRLPICGARIASAVQPAKERWWCRQCSPDGRWEDGIAYLRRRHGMSSRGQPARDGRCP